MYKIRSNLYRNIADSLQNRYNGENFSGEKNGQISKWAKMPICYSNTGIFSDMIISGGVMRV